MSGRESIESVVREGLCTSCGTCVAICPKDAVRMEETPVGLLFAKVTAETCDSCGLCLRICGGSHLEEGLLPAEVDPFKGEVLAAYCGYSTDPDIRQRGQSGGVVTALLNYMLETGQASHTLVTRMPEDGSLRAKALLTNQREDLQSAQGSKYCPVALNSVIPRAIGKDTDKVAVVGLPCHVHSIRNAQQFHGNWQDGIGLTIGLFCDRTLAASAIDYLIAKGKLARDEVEAFRYRDKTQGGWPGTIYMRAKDQNEVRLPTQERQAIKEFFTPLRCRLCFDKMNVLSDIAVGDAWGVREDGNGFSVLLARTQKGMNALQKAMDAGVLSLVEVSANAIFEGQAIEKRRDHWGAYTKIWRKMRRKTPFFSISDDWVPVIGDEIFYTCRTNIKLSIMLINNKSITYIKRCIKLTTIKNKSKKMIDKIFKFVKNSEL